MNDSLSDRLIENIESISDFIEPILNDENAEVLLGEEASPLLRFLEPKVLVTLAFISSYLDAIWFAFDTESDDLGDSVDLVDEFITSAMNYYQTHLDGYDEGDDGLPLTPAAFLFSNFAQSFELFGSQCERTNSLAWTLAGLSRTDVKVY